MHRCLGLTLALVVAGATGLAMSPAAEARPFVQAHSWEAGLSMGDYVFAAGSPGLKATFDYRIHGAYNFTHLLGAELAFELAPKEINATSLYILHLDLMIHPWVHNWFVPFVGIGPSFATTVPTTGASESRPGVNALLGVKLYPWAHVGFRIDARYLARFATAKGENTAHDVIATVGLFVTFGGTKAPPKLLDTDKDGIPDIDDACPKVPGVASAKGCPDKDGDSIRDSLDRCPNVPGPAKFKGCPDTDNDGIPDIDDRCPKVAGPAKFKGCPDTDKDGIPDIDDRCPKIPGEAKYQGCPPPPPKEVSKRFNGAIKGITFAFDSDVIASGSGAVLDATVAVMKKYPQLRIRVTGYTSDEGTPAYNFDLSKRRAASVKKYLIDHGIAADRLETKGMGATDPVAPNNTEANRKKNRRIEFKILRQ